MVFRLSAMSNNPRKEVSKMNKIFFWDNGIRNAVIENFNDISNRRDIGILWENFVISERMKWLAWHKPQVKSFFWRNYNQSEVDYVERDGQHLHAYEIKWNSQKKHSISRAFTNAYPDSTVQIITPRNVSEFLIGGMAG